MSRNLIVLLFVWILLLASCGQNNSNSWHLSSPDNQMRLTASLDANGTLHYSLFSGDRIVIGASPLGIVFKETSFENGLTLVEKSEQKGLRDSYTLLAGKRLENTVEWNELHLKVKNPDNASMRLEFRLFDDGLAFRYVLAEGNDAAYTLDREATAFQVPLNGLKWLHPYDTLSPWSPAYETFYENGIPVGTEAPWNKNGWAFPMLFHTETDWLLISESGLGPDYVGMHIEGNPTNGLYSMRLPEEGEAMGRCGNQPVLTLPFSTPWRVIITSEDLAGIVESTLVTDVAEVRYEGDISWIKPGRASWSWWSEHSSPRDFQKLKEYVDFTASMGWEYFLVDANWNHMTGGTLEQLTKYATGKGVGILAWYNSGSSHNVVTEEPRDLMGDSVARRAEFSKISQWGIKGIKVDFFQSDKACIIAQYHEILKDAADYRLLVNFHGSTLPRGWERTYPHLMSMEAVRGGEAYNFDRTYPSFAPFHNTILVFTRNVIGPMDYTPVTFSDVTYPHITTYAHELALAALFESGIQHFADNYKSYLEQPEFILNYLRDIPVTWDETRFIDGYPGKLAVLARRHGDTWYLSGINGLNEQQAVNIKFAFLGTGSWKMELISDGESDRTFAFRDSLVDKNKEMSIEMLPFGGFAAVIRPD